MSESTTSAPPPSISLQDCAGAAGSRKSSWRKSTPAIGAMSRMSIATTLPLPSAAPTRLAATVAPAAGRGAEIDHARRPASAGDTCRRSRSACRRRASACPSRLARATYGSLSWRSSQRFCETVRFFFDFSRTVSGRSLTHAHGRRPAAQTSSARISSHQHALAQAAVGDAQPLARETRGGSPPGWRSRRAPDRRARRRCRGLRRAPRSSWRSSSSSTACTCASTIQQPSTWRRS